MRALIVAAIALSFASAAYADENKITKRVEVDGVPYRVTTKDRAVSVARKSLFVNFTLEERDRQRRAVVAATGCKAVDEIQTETARLRAKLDCSRSAD